MYSVAFFGCVRFVLYVSHPFSLTSTKTDELFSDTWGGGGTLLDSPSSASGQQGSAALLRAVREVVEVTLQAVHVAALKLVDHADNTAEDQIPQRISHHTDLNLKSPEYIGWDPNPKPLPQ